MLTVAWEISWYQYRITPESGQPVRLEERGHDPGEVESMFTTWNARLAPGRPDRPRDLACLTALLGPTYNPKHR